MSKNRSFLIIRILFLILKMATLSCSNEAAYSSSSTQSKKPKSASAEAEPADYADSEGTQDPASEDDKIIVDVTDGIEAVPDQQKTTSGPEVPNVTSPSPELVDTSEMIGCKLNVLFPLSNDHVRLGLSSVFFDDREFGKTKISDISHARFVAVYTDDGAAHSGHISVTLKQVLYAKQSSSSRESFNIDIRPLLTGEKWSDNSATFQCHSGSCLKHVALFELVYRAKTCHGRIQ